MKVNEAGWDRGARIALGVVFGAIALAMAGIWSWVFAVLAAVMLVTAALGFCPLYALMGLNTCSVEGR